MDLTWERRSANVWIAGDYTITRQWLRDGRRGRVYEIRAPGRREPVTVRDLEVAKQACQIHAWMEEVGRQAKEAARQIVEEWPKVLSGALASVTETLDRWVDAMSRSASGNGNTEEVT